MLPVWLPAPLIDAAIAIGIGLFIGLEREHRDAETKSPDHETLMGVRTFALLALFGWLAGAFTATSAWIPVAALLAAGGLIAVGARAPGLESRGLTTEVAALATFLLGMFVHHDRLLAIAIALAVMLLLISKPWFRSLVPKLQRMDLTSTLQLAVLLAIVLPILPTEARDPWGVLSPRRLGVFVALIAGISYVGYVLHRSLGGQRGAGLTGLVGGLASSTAVTAAMAQQARLADAMVGPGQLATMLASLVMAVRVVVVAALIDRRVALAMAGPVGALALGLLVGSAWRWRTLKKGPAAKTDVTLKNPFSILPALKWGVMLAGILVLSAVMKQWLGTAGLLATAAVSGLMDVDAINLAATRDSAADAISPAIAALAVMIAVGSNMAVKTGIAFFGGGRAYGTPVAVVFGSATAAGLAIAIALSA